MNSFLWSKASLLVFSATWPIRNHFNMLIRCSRNMYYDCKCWKQLCCFNVLFNCFVENAILFLFIIFGWTESSKEQHLFAINQLQKYISGCISKLSVYWWGFQWVTLKPSMVPVHPWLWILHSTAIWRFETVLCHITGWPEFTQREASQLAIWVA